MKKFCIVLLLVSYLVPAVGVGVNLHWCGHILFAVSMDSDAHQDCLCTQFKEVGSDSKPDCCKDDYVYYKLSQQHTSSSIFSLNQFVKSVDQSFIKAIPIISFWDSTWSKASYLKSKYKKDRRPPDLEELSILRV
ncbi:MAG: HYC_CC_PP family protein [Bacteroidia bacterium]